MAIGRQRGTAAATTRTLRALARPWGLC